MLDSPIPDNEEARLQTLNDYDLVETGSEDQFDDLVQLAADVAAVPMAMITVLDRDRQLIKSQVGLPDTLKEAPRPLTFCTHAVALGDVLEVSDTKHDERFADNPFVNGEPFVRYYYGVPLVTEEGHALGTLCVMDTQPRTLSERTRHSLNALTRVLMRQMGRRREQRFSHHIGRMIEESDYFIAMVEEGAGTLAYANNRLRRFCESGTTTGDIAAIPVLSLFPELRQETLDWHFQRASEDGDAIDIPSTNLSFGRVEKTVRLRIVPSAIHGRSVLLLIAEDIEPLLTSRREAERASAEVRSLAHVARLTQNPVIITGADGRIQWVNPSFENLTGYTMDEVVGKRPSRMLQGEETSQEARQRISQHLQAGLPVREEILNYSRSGRAYWLELDIQPVRNEQGELINFVAVETDITQRKEQENQLRKAKEAAEASNRAKSQFLANISHELRTPLNGIVGISELLRKNPRRRDGEQQLVTLNQSAQGLLEIINDLLDLSKIEAQSLTLESAPFDLHQLLQDLRNLFTPQLEAKGIRMHLVGLEGTPRYVQGDSLRLRQVLTNLLGNAVKFTEQGFVELAVSLASTVGDTYSLQFHVRDSGIGIPEDARERIFEPFAQADDSLSRRFGGTGLGLAICRRLVQLMGGDIDVSSILGKGTTFAFVTRLLAASSVDMTDSQHLELQDTAQALIQGRRVLVVDDNAINRQVAGAMLEELGARVLLCGSGLEAVDQVTSETFDLILLDIQMPDMDGFAVARELRQIDRERSRKTPIIALTAYSTAEFLERPNAGEMDGYVAKPLTFANLSRSLLRHLSDVELEESSGEKPVFDSVEDRSSMGNRLVDDALVQRNLNGDMNMIHTLVDLFKSQYSGYLGSIESAMAAQDMETVASAAHSLKGAISYFNQGALWEEVSELEKAARAGDGEEVGHLFALIGSEVRALADEIERLYN